ncbi:hypothetical protein [Pseudarthrobacter defluvii]|uniref:hypothetical protein n=1 Tax=Pseudarthrobacter defluvii TaxID=410837 RepID=UPI002577A17B|nr:hypothetical protein [Pseudarthrobacter defluvii]WJH26708.1 hypothetical protein JCQ34_19755 [Pseudarthrobacter defluvii]
MTLLRIRAEEMDAPVVPSDVSQIVQATEPIEVRLDEVHAGPVQAAASEMQVKLERGQPGFAYIEESDVLMVRLEHKVSCFLESAPDAPTDLRLHHIVAFKVLQELEVSADAIGAFIETNAYFIAYPYVRQSITQLTAALGLPPVVLGFMKRNEWPYHEEQDDNGAGSDAQAHEDALQASQ